MSPSLLALPPEVRLVVYHYYLTEPGGYHYDYDSYKFRTADQKRIDLSLMYTCRLIATEMEDLAFQKNAITFSTLRAEDQQVAFWFNCLLVDAEQAQTKIMQHSIEKDGQSEFTKQMGPDVKARVEAEHPYYQGLLPSSPEEWHQMEFDRMLTSPYGYWGDTWSNYQEFMNCTIRHLAVKAGYPQPVSHKSPFYCSWLHNPPTFSPLNLWDVPSVEEIDQMLEVDGNNRQERLPRYQERYSAAAGAIRFLKSISRDRRLKFKKIIIDEDRNSLMRPFCHAIGLIPYCLENPDLRIERRVNVWKTVLAARDRRSVARMVVEDNEHYFDPTRQGKIVPTSRIHLQFSDWINEALSLEKKGMPAGSFTLLFDGDPVPNQCTEIFEILKRDAAFQALRDRWMARRDLNLPLVHYKHHFWCYTFDEFPQAINDIISGNSNIRCNFDTGDHYDLNLFSAQIQDERADSLGWWADQWDKSHEGKIGTSPPLPPYPEMLYYDVFPRMPGCRDQYNN